MMPMLAIFNFAGFVIGMTLVLLLVIYPIGRILQRVGWNPWLSLLWLVPVINVVMLWLLAFGRWTVQSPDSRTI